MKKILLAVALALGVGTASQAQSFAKGDNVFNIGIGTGAIVSGANLSIPAVSAIYETGVADGLFATERGSIGVGAQFDFVGYKAAGISGSSVFVGPRLALHYEFVENLDTYGGIGAGYYTEGFSGFRTNAFGFQGFMGARYYFNTGLGAFAEFGSGIAYAKVGFSLKF